MNLERVIRDAIEFSSKKRITFAEFMDLVLYHPELGYYTAGTVAIGAKGDFFTSSSLGIDLGQLLAVQFVEMGEFLGDLESFTLVEVGAGSGVLAKDILDYLSQQNREFYDRLTYLIIEQSPSLIQQQQETLQKYLDKDPKVCWKGWDELAAGSITGCVFSNELIDAFPVHRVTIENGELKEIYVTLEGEMIDELSTEEISRYFELVGVEIPSSLYSDGFSTEVNLLALKWLEIVSQKLDRGYVLTIDYGYSAPKYYHPQRHRGTLQCYSQHKHHDNPYVYLGQQDITAHVDFTALERQGEGLGLKTIGFTQQGLFLMALGLGERLGDLSSGKYDFQTILQRRDALHQLIDPTGLGGFGVLIQGKGVENRSLRGLGFL